MIDFVYSKDFLPKMTKHAYQPSISELILSFIAYESIQYEESNVSYFNIKINVVQKLLDNFAIECHSEVIKIK